MKRNTIYAYAAICLVLLGGAGMYVGYKGYKKYKAKQNQEFRYQGTMGKAREGFDKEKFKDSILADALIDQVIEDNRLLDAWGMTDAEAAKSRIREKFLVTVTAMEVKVSYQDKDKAIAKSILESIVNNYYKQAKPTGVPTANPSTP
ncbi:MAG: hypothetical protein KJO79_10670 [Verrucomicrobiae bacterium]|nr:hypothetical protein [Verrucomicrobiae bacterium]NNJ87637.1 hypothetical protein [Akkermansiaceae bacterium]